MFKDQYPHIHFIRGSGDEDKRKEESKLLDKKYDKNRSRSRSELEQERPMSFFEKTILSKNKRLVQLLEEEEKARQREKKKIS